MEDRYDNWPEAVAALAARVDDLTLQLQAEQCYSAAISALITGRLGIPQSQIHEAVIIGMRQMHRINPRGEAIIEIMKERLPPGLFAPDDP